MPARETHLEACSRDRGRQQPSAPARLLRDALMPCYRSAIMSYLVQGLSYARQTHHRCRRPSLGFCCPPVGRCRRECPAGACPAPPAARRLPGEMRATPHGLVPRHSCFRCRAWLGSPCGTPQLQLLHDGLHFNFEFGNEASNDILLGWDTVRGPVRAWPGVAIFIQ